MSQAQPDIPMMDIPLPHCQFCDQEIATPALFFWEHGAWVILCVFCPHCRKNMVMNVVPQVAAAAAVAGFEQMNQEAQSRLHRA